MATSSRADKLSREDEAWQHGGFSKVLLDALSADDIDTDQNGVISMTDLTAYMEKRLDLLTGGDQQLGVSSASRARFSSSDCNAAFPTPARLSVLPGEGDFLLTVTATLNVLAGSTAGFVCA